MIILCKVLKFNVKFVIIKWCIKNEKPRFFGAAAEMKEDGLCLVLITKKGLS